MNKNHVHVAEVYQLRSKWHKKQHNPAVSARSDFEDSKRVNWSDLSCSVKLLLVDWKTLRQAYYPYFTTRAYQNQRHETRWEDTDVFVCVPLTNRGQTLILKIYRENMFYGKDERHPVMISSESYDLA